MKKLILIAAAVILLSSSACSANDTERTSELTALAAKFAKMSDAELIAVAREGSRPVAERKIAPDFVLGYGALWSAELTARGSMRAAVLRKACALRYVTNSHDIPNPCLDEIYLDILSNLADAVNDMPRSSIRVIDEKDAAQTEAQVAAISETGNGLAGAIYQVKAAIDRAHLCDGRTATLERSPTDACARFRYHMSRMDH